MRTFLFLGLLAAIAFFPGCGDAAKIVVVSGAEAGELPTQQVVEAEEEVKIGLWDESPREGDEILGPITYSFLPAPEGSKPKRGGEVRAAVLEDIDSLNPFLSSSATASEVHDKIFPRLMIEQPDYYDGVPTFTPYMAESWVIAPDNLSIRFTLRDAKWSDGEPFKSEDIRFSWLAAKDPDVAWVSASIVDFISDVEVHSPREFTVHYTKPTPYNIMDINDVQIIPQHTFGTVPFGKWSGYPKWAELAVKACGGPWVLDEHVPDQEIRLKPNPEYWDKGKPYLDRLTFVIFANMNSMLNALLAGQVDIMDSILPSKAKQVIEDEDLWLYTCVARSYGYAGWNCKRFPFDDAAVRNAMTMAIDREDIVEGEFYGYAKVAAPFIIRSMWASDRAQKPLPYDPAGAEKLLEEAGWKKNADGIQEKDGRELAFKLITNSGNEVRKAICERFQSDLRKIGVKVEIRRIDFNQMSQRLKQHDFQAYVGGWYIATKIDPKPTFHSVSAQGRYNYVNYSNPYIDELIDRGRIMNISDPAVREEARGVWKAFQKVLFRDQPYTMIYEPRKLTGISKKFVNVRVSSLRWLDNVEEWWVK